jgi:hypothetical protein
MTRAALLLPVVLTVLGCGNLDRDVIVASGAPDGDVAVDAGASAPREEDASPPTPRHSEPAGCILDGGCEPIRCAPRECSRYCPWGCGDPYPTSPATTYHSRPRTGLP